MKPPTEECLFAATLARPASERAVFLDGACHGDPALRRRVEELLAAHESPDPFLEPPAAFPGKTTVLLPLKEGPGTLIGRYKLLEQVGEGGFGIVYVAEQREPVKRRVALKIIKLGMDTKQVVARFEAERQALALMDHPNIAKVLDAGATDTGRPYFVMELVKGIPITHYCDQEKLGTRERLDLFIKICHAIQHAHQKGIIHRDIKPSNILVTLHDGVPVPKVIDFGIAKATQQELTEKTVYTQFQQFIGTPAYMSPEQAEMSGLDIDTRSDIYSLGVLLYELLTGSTPFDTKELLQSGLDEMRKIIRERQPVRPSTRLRQTSVTESPSPLAPRPSPLAPDLDWIVMKCLEKDRTRRYETANGLARDIERHLKHEPVVARPPSVGYRLEKSFRRNKLVFAAAGLVGLALVLGVVVSSWQAIRATKAGQRETIARLRADEAAHVAASEKERAEQEAQKAKVSERAAREAAEAARQNLYAADMILAHQAWQENNLGLALEKLNKHRPAPQEVDLRGWEWRYLWGLCQSDALYTLGQHSTRVFGLAVSPNGRRLATTALGGELKIWDLDSRRLVASPEANGNSVAFSSDGKLLAFDTHGDQCEIKLWDVQEHRVITHFPLEHGGGLGVPALGFSPSGRQLAIGAKGGPVVLWDVAAHAILQTFQGHSSDISSLVFSPDGRNLITGGWDRTIRVWSLTNAQQIAVFTNHTHRVQCVALSPDGKTVASGSWDETIRIWDLAQPGQVAVLTNHTGGVTALAFSPEGKFLASASADHTIKFWETGDWREVSTLRGSEDAVYGIVFSPEGKTLFSGTRGGKILAWSGTPRPRKAQVLRRPDDAQGAEGFVNFPNSGFGTFSIYGNPACWHRNKTFSLWDPLTLRKLPAHPEPDLPDLWKTNLQGLWTNVVGMALSPGGERWAFASRDGSLYLWDVEEERLITRWPVWPSAYSLEVDFSPDGKLLVAAAGGKNLKLWNVEKLEEVASLPKSPGAPYLGCFSPHGEAVALANVDGTVEAWDLLRKQRVAYWKAHKEGVTGVAFMPDGKRLVTVSFDSTATLWELEAQPEPREVRSFGRALDEFYCVAVSSDGERIAAGTGERLIKIWNVTTGQEVATLKGINDWVDPNLVNRRDGLEGLAFAPPDGNTLISSTRDEVRLWRAPSWAEIEAAEARERKEAGAQ